MVEKILDLHVHSKYSRACSKDLELPKIAEAAATRGIDIVATGDFTHPKWMEHIKEMLVEENEGIYSLKSEIRITKFEGNSKFKIQNSGTRFIIGTEISSIKKHAGETRRLHLLIFSPDLAVTEKFNKTLNDRGFNLGSDGRPILGLTAKQILELMLETDERMVMAPAHAWTPWFGIFGSRGGYDSLAECFEDLTPHIFAMETGLSSDPLMNWRWSALDNITLISNSDAHSPAKLGREANVLRFGSEDEVTYDEIMRVLRARDRDRFLYTIEFYPEEGKYHLDGHRDCQFVCAPEETKKYKGICPRCKKALVIGVMNRVAQLADRSEDQAKAEGARRVGYKNLVPLPEILADTFACGAGTKRVQDEYRNLIKRLGSEFYILLHCDLKEIEAVSTKPVATAVDRVRRGEIYIQPGYDGVFGVVKVFRDDEPRGRSKQAGFDFD